MQWYAYVFNIRSRQNLYYDQRLKEASSKNKFAMENWRVVWKKLARNLFVILGQETKRLRDSSS